MEPRRFILRLLTLLAACLLVSCIDGREEVWLNADGSGRADVSYSLPAAAAAFQGGEDGVRRMIEGFLKKSPAISSSRCEVTQINDRLVIRVRASFDSAGDLGKISQGQSLEKLPSSANHLAGKFRVKQQRLSVDFSRTITAGGALPGATFMPESQFNGRNLTYIIHLPEAASESNATRVGDGGRMLAWEFPLAMAIRDPIIIRFKAPIPIPIPWIAAAGGIFLVLALFGIRKLRMTKRRN